MTLNQRLVQSLPILLLVTISAAVGFGIRGSGRGGARIEYLSPEKCTKLLDKNTGNIDWGKKSTAYAPKGEPGVSLTMYSAKDGNQGDVADLGNGKLLGAISNDGTSDSKLFGVPMGKTACVWFVVEPGSSPFGLSVLTMRIIHQAGEKGDRTLKGTICTHPVGSEPPEWDKPVFDCSATFGLAIRKDSTGVHYPSFLDEGAESPGNPGPAIVEVDAIMGPWLPCASNGCCRGY